LLLFQNEANRFQSYFELYSHDFEKFKTQYKTIFKKFCESDTDHVEPLDALYIFGRESDFFYLIDWHGEERMYEIEEYIENFLHKKRGWKNTDIVRSQSTLSHQRDGKFIVKLFHSIDSDLQEEDKRLLFLDLGGDSFIFTVVDISLFRKILTQAPGYFFSVEDI
jgi:hypothetical protein